MNRTIAQLGVALAVVFGWNAHLALAEETTEERLQRVEAQVEELKRGLGTESPEEGDEGYGGRVSFHGYGELHYNNPRTGSAVPQSSAPAQMDFHRMVWGLSYHYNDRISLHTEVDFEHAATEIELEFAYLDFLVTPAFNVRAGNMLMPVGPLNEFHEPTLFYSVERPYVQNVIIPTSWQEGGVGVFGSVPGGIRYRVYLVSGLNAEGFSSATGIRSGRGHVAEAPSEDLAVVGRLEYIGTPGIEIGASAYQGGANPNKNPALGSASVGIWEGDVRFRKAGFDLRGVLASVQVDGADQISVFRTQTIGDEMLGWYAEGAYDLLKLLAPQADQSLVAFVRYEDFNTHESIPTGFTVDPTNDRQVTTTGLAYYPHQDVAIKGDWERWEDGMSDTASRWNLGIGYQF
jgi:hypothetical protein